MAFDGVVISSLVRELSDNLVGVKIEKIHQPEKDELSMKVKTREDSYKLILSASASTPMVYISKNHDKLNPKKAPMFCMTLRKHIQGGVITEVSQVGFERIIRISIESYDELRTKTTKYLYVEIMGKHSNIILVNQSDAKIIDSIKRIPLSVSRVRQILPGNDYDLPPAQSKLSPLTDVDFDKLNEMKISFINDGKNLTVSKFIYMSILGFSPVIANKICFELELDYDMKLDTVSDENLKDIVCKVNDIIKCLMDNNISPNIVIDRSRDKVLEFSSINLSQYENMEINKIDTVSDMIEEYYYLKDKMERISQRASNLKKSLSLNYERVSKKIVKQKKELKDSLRADDFKKLGELVTAYIYKINQGDDEVEVEDFYNNNELIKIKLDPTMSPSENAQRYFKKYNKLKTAFEELTVLIEENEHEREYLENTLLSLENCDSLEELKEIREELMREGYVRTFKMPKKNIKPASEILKFMTDSGKMIMVGKNNKQNDYLTLRLADNDDLWFHTKEIPGSHVVLKCAGQNVEEQDIVQAATLASYYSKAKMSQNVPVDYTKKKNVKKPSGAKPGLVIYEKNKTIFVTPSDENKAKINKV